MYIFSFTIIRELRIRKSVVGTYLKDRKNLHFSGVSI